MNGSKNDTVISLGSLFSNPWGRILRSLPIALLVLLCLAGCEKRQFSDEMTVQIFKNYSVQFPGAVEPGTPIPDQYSKMEVPICSIPAEAQLCALMEARLGPVGNFVRNSYTIDKLELLESKITAISGSFESFTYVKMDFMPRDVDGEAQPPLALGAAESAGGLGTVVVLTPPVPVDLVKVMHDESANSETSCSFVHVEGQGVATDQPLATDVSIRVRITVTATGFLLSTALMFMQMFS